MKVVYIPVVKNKPKYFSLVMEKLPVEGLLVCLQKLEAVCGRSLPNRPHAYVNITVRI